MDKFRNMGLSPNFLRALEDLKINEPTEIQEKIIPIALSGQDVMGESATGSGKTLAFGAPIIEKTRSRGGLQVLVMAPTRELAEQVARSLKSFSRYNPLEINTVYGGVPIDAQIRYLKKSDIIVGTPGRILDHISRKTIDLSKIKILVLDEADRMLDMGFIYDVTDILHYCPKEKQTLLFSATLSDEIIAISRKYMKNPKEISAEPEVDPSKLRQVFYDVPSNQKFSLLVHLLKQEKSGLVMIFCNTKRNADLISENLSRHGFDAMALHGNLSQTKRSRVLEKFHQSQKFILVCTDVAARGLDIKGVSHVYNYEFPKTRDEYTHRIGRTARAGKDGKAITILSDRDYQNFRNATKYDSKVEILPLPRFEQVVIRMKEPQDSRSGSQGRFGKNPRGRNTRSSGPRSRGNSAPRSSNPRSSSPRGRSPPRGRNYSRR